MKTPRAMPVTAVDTAVTKIVAHFGAKSTKVFRAADGEAIVECQDIDRGLSLVRIVDGGNDDRWVACLYVKPKNLEPGLPDQPGDFNAHFMFDTTKDWWPAEH